MTGLDRGRGALEFRPLDGTGQDEGFGSLAESLSGRLNGFNDDAMEYLNTELESALKRGARGERLRSN